MVNHLSQHSFECITRHHYILVSRLTPAPYNFFHQSRFHFEAFSFPLCAYNLFVTLGNKIYIEFNYIKMYIRYEIVSICPYHFVRTTLSNTFLSLYHFVHTILSATILSGHPYGPYRPPLDGPFRRTKNGPSQMRRSASRQKLVKDICSTCATYMGNWAMTNTSTAHCRWLGGCSSSMGLCHGQL